MRSWTYFIQLVGRNDKGEEMQEGALYIVAVPLDKNLFQAQKLSCFSEHYLPEESAINHGKAFAVGVEFEVKDPDSYGLSFYREDDELYIFKEGISMKEGLKRVYRLLMDRLKEQGYGVDYDTIVDMGNPSEELMRECLLEAIKGFEPSK
ncbi:hypothetical protein BCF55_1498 [Hydrogenivirga caldilitoris]|uniref:Uncharacterized protein n=1 Tax=Hydrogenivirga caldilitoris TaxID=246264 RepID=A0A497XSW6_9AQUI|nr:hypothetical protein [Hydrogenivirga caldilitoris]RLJ71199.1 hypothetical protein BCF55_1498 [Hydrogenivirga caldilitoris]